MILISQTTINYYIIGENVLLLLFQIHIDSHLACK